MSSDSQQALEHLLGTLPEEIAALDDLATAIRRLNHAASLQPIDLEPVLVAKMWMQRILRHAQCGHVDARGVFELAKFVSRQMPALNRLYLATLGQRLNDQEET